MAAFKPIHIPEKYRRQVDLSVSLQTRNGRRTDQANYKIALTRT